MPTGQAIFTQAWIDLGVGAPGEIPGASESANGLAKLNIMLENWAGARDLVYEIADNNYALTATQSFPIGAAAAAPFNVARPIKIENAQIVITVGGKDLSFDLQIASQAQWQSIDDKAATGTIPTMLYYDPAVPNGILNFWPIPLCVTATKVDLGTWNVVGQFATLATNITFPPAYYRAVLLGLQLELIPTYGALVSPQITQMRSAQFQEALSVIRTLNSTVQMMPLKPSAPAPTTQPQQQQQGA